jgi:hypothetical protein
VSQAALALLQTDDSSADDSQQSPSKRAIDLLEGKAQVAERLPVSGIEHARKALSVFAQHPFTAATGMLENAVSGVTGGVGSLVEAVTGSDPGTYSEKLAYRPRTEAGSQIAELGGEEAAKIGSVYDQVAGTGPLAQTIKERIPQFAAAAGTVSGLAEVPRLGRVSPHVSPLTPTVEQIVTDAASKQSMGAAAAVPSRLATASPELQAAIRAEARSGGVDLNTLDRHLEADSLPVRVRLTRGQATQDPVLISDEMNRRGKDPEFAARFNEQNQQLIDNLDEIRREASPNVVGNDPIQNGQQIVDSYKSIDQTSRDEINAAYKAARDANGGDLPMDAQAFTKTADAALKKNMKARYVPSEIAADLAEIRETGSMNFETFENLRTNLAAEARKAERSGDGNAAAAVNLIRDAIENVEPMGKAKEVKPLFDQARSLAKARFDRVKADPAYKAAIEDAAEVGQASPLADQFVEKYIVKGKGAHLDRMRENLANDPTANEVISAAALNYLKAKSGVNLYTNEGNFSQAGFNRALAEITPKLDRLVSPQAAEQIQTLGNVSRYVMAQPRGSFVNNSNTTVAAHAANIAKGVAERSVNAMVPGADLGTLGREKLAKRAEKKEVQEALKPGAGIGMKPKKGQP